jgi:hypothetical protein
MLIFETTQNFDNWYSWELTDWKVLENMYFHYFLVELINFDSK